jgi:hypothetical protein
MPWVIGVDFDGFAQFSIIASRFDLDCDFALPARGNCPIVIGNGTASAGANLFYLEGLVTRVSDFETVGHNRALVHFFEIKELLVNSHPRPGRIADLVSQKQRTEKKEDQSEKV